MSEILRFQHERATCELVVWNEKTATLSNVYSVKPRRGHATELIKKVTAYADEHGLTILLEVQRYGGDHTSPDNAGLKRFYRRFGFVTVVENTMQRVYSQELHGF